MCVCVWKRFQYNFYLNYSVSKSTVRHRLSIERFVCKRVVGNRRIDIIRNFLVRPDAKAGYMWITHDDQRNFPYVSLLCIGMSSAYQFEWNCWIINAFTFSHNINQLNVSVAIYVSIVYKCRIFIIHAFKIELPFVSCIYTLHIQSAFRKMIKPRCIQSTHFNQINHFSHLVLENWYMVRQLSWIVNVAVCAWCCFSMKIICHRPFYMRCGFTNS